MTLSLTQHYSLLRDYINTFETLMDTSKIKNNLNAVKQIIFYGLKVEVETDTDKMKSYRNLISDESKKIGMVYKTGNVGLDNKAHEYVLPDISNAIGFMYGIIYLKYLRNYEKVSYQGHFLTAFPYIISKLINHGIDKERPLINDKADFLEKRINEYCLKNKINFLEVKAISLNFNDSSFIKKIIPLLPSIENKETIETKDKDYTLLRTQAHTDLAHAQSVYTIYLKDNSELENEKKTLTLLMKKKLNSDSNSRCISFFFISELDKKINQTQKKIEKIKRKIEPSLPIEILFFNKIQAKEKYNKAFYNEIFHRSPLKY